MDKSKELKEKQLRQLNKELSSYEEQRKEAKEKLDEYRRNFGFLSSRESFKKAEAAHLKTIEHWEQEIKNVKKEIESI